MSAASVTAVGSPRAVSAAKLGPDSTAWGESLSAAYGFHRELVGGWFIEPEAGLGWAHLGGSDYTLSDGTKATQGAANALLGHGRWF